VEPSRIPAGLSPQSGNESVRKSSNHAEIVAGTSTDVLEAVSSIVIPSDIAKSDCAGAQQFCSLHLGYENIHDFPSYSCMFCLTSVQAHTESSSRLRALDDEQSQMS
jgi:hypothetical protein